MPAQNPEAIKIGQRVFSPFIYATMSETDVNSPAIPDLYVEARRILFMKLTIHPPKATSAPVYYTILSACVKGIMNAVAYDISEKSSLRTAPVGYFTLKSPRKQSTYAKEKCCTHPCDPVGNRLSASTTLVA
jgi:hypothetical protein